MNKANWRKPAPQPEDCHFIVKKDEGKVICIIDDVKYDAYDYFNHCTPFSCAYYDIQNVQIPDRFVGIATCSKDDEWDEHIGRVIAYNRALKKYSKCFFKAINRLVNTIDDMLNRFTGEANNYGAKLAAAIDSSDNWIAKKTTPNT